jgi:hypothetical protein
MNHEAIQKRVTKALGGKYHKPVGAPRAFLAWQGFGWLIENNELPRLIGSSKLRELLYISLENRDNKIPEQFLLAVDIWLQGERGV